MILVKRTAQKGLIDGQSELVVAAMQGRMGSLGGIGAGLVQGA